MNIAQIKQLEVGMSGIATTGNIGYRGDPQNIKGKKSGNPYDFWTQFVTIKDSMEEIGASIVIDPTAPLARNEQVFIEKATLDSYQKDNKTILKLKVGGKNWRRGSSLLPTHLENNQPANSKKEVDWDAKDLRMARMNALTNATAIFTLMKDVFTDLEHQTTENMAKTIQDVAEVHINYIYKGKQPPEGDDIPF